MTDTLFALGFCATGLDIMSYLTSSEMACGRGKDAMGR